MWKAVLAKDAELVMVGRGCGCGDIMIQDSDAAIDEGVVVV